MSFTNYKIYRIQDGKFCLELKINSKNENDFKCSLEFEKEIKIDGLPPILLQSHCLCENNENNITTTNVSIHSELLDFDEIKDPFMSHAVSFEDEEEEDGENVTEESEVSENLEERTEIEDKEEKVVEEKVEEEVVEEKVEEVVVEEKVEEVVEEKTEEVEVEEKTEEVVEEVVEEVPHNDINDILINFNETMKHIIVKLDNLDKLNQPKDMWEQHTTESGYIYWWNNITEESRWTNPFEDESKPQPPPSPKKEQKPLPPPRSPSPIISETEPLIMENLSPIIERKPHHPPPQSPSPIISETEPLIMENRPPIIERKPHPPPQPFDANKSKLIAKINQIQNNYINCEDIDKKVIPLIIEHMRIIEPTNISGKEKKNIVLGSIETIFAQNNVENKDVLLYLCSQLIDTFIAFDKHKINIEEKLSPLSCLGC
jgi:hypothetical protein